MALLLKVLSKCNTCCQNWIEPWIVRNNREMAFRSIIKLCYKCHPSSRMESMHTYYYPRNSKARADPLAWKQYKLFSFFPFPLTHSEPSNSKTQMCTIIYEALALQFPFLMLCSVFPFFSDRKSKAAAFFLFFNLRTWAWLCQWSCAPNPAVLSVSLVGLSCWVTAILAKYLIVLLKLYLPYKTKRLFRTDKMSLIISTSKVKCVYPYDDRVAVKRLTVGWHIAVRQMKTFPASAQRLVQVKVKGCWSDVTKSKPSVTYLFASVDLYSSEDVWQYSNTEAFLRGRGFRRRTESLRCRWK